ncbi:MAG: copper tolerance protein [Nitrospinaceae bacterium]|nr:MAG: copper tolerance protein [Nitrospinaceae bacterium]
MKLCQRYIILTIPFLVAACATVNPQRDFDAVSSSTKSKIGHSVTWQQSEEDKKQTRIVLEKLLEGGVTRQEVVRIALMNNQDLQTKFEFLGIARADVVQAGLYSNPSIDALLEFPVKGAFGVGPDLNLLFSLSDLWNVPLRKKIAVLDGQKVTLQVIEEILKTAAEAREAFDEVLFQNALHDSSQKNIKLFESAFDKSKLYYQSGLVNDLELWLAESTLYEEKMALAKIETDLQAAQTALLRQLGMDPLKSMIEIQGEFQETQAVDLQPGQAWNFALENRADLKIFRFQIEQSKWVLQLQEARIYGDVNFGGNYTKELEGGKSSGPLLSFQIPIFDQNQAGIARAQYQLRQSEKELAANEIKAKEEILGLIQKLKFQHKKATLLRDKMLILNRKTEKFAEKFYNAMQLNAFSLIEARRRVLNTFRNYLKARRDYQHVKTTLEVALGGKMPDPKN